MWCAFDLEASFILKGCKRHQSRVLEWGMVRTVKGKRKTFHALVNPFGTPLTRDSMKDTDPEKTMRFWVNLLSRHKLLNTAVRRKSVDDQIAAVAELAEKGTFQTTEEALEGALAFGSGATWIAHNCKSFDAPIVRGLVNKYKQKMPTFADSLPVVRRLVDLPSHSQPLVYKHLFKKKVYPAHLALEDAKALYKILMHLGKDDVMSLFRDLQGMKGVGPKSEKVFEKKGILNQADLRAWVKVNSKEEFLATFKGVHRHKKLADRLYPKKKTS